MIRDAGLRAWFLNRDSEFYIAKAIRKLLGKSEIQRGSQCGWRRVGSVIEDEVRAVGWQDRAGLCQSEQGTCFILSSLGSF